MDVRVAKEKIAKGQWDLEIPEELRKKPKKTDKIIEKPLKRSLKDKLTRKKH